MANFLFTKSNTKHNDFVSLLFHAEVQFHIYHLQTKSYEVHMALGGFYTGIQEFIDSLVETLQGKEKALIVDYNLPKVRNIVSVADIIKELEDLNTKSREYSKSLGDNYSNIQNQIQTFQDSLETTVYKLKFLE